MCHATCVLQIWGRIESDYDAKWKPILNCKLWELDDSRVKEFPLPKEIPSRTTFISINRGDHHKRPASSMFLQLLPSEPIPPNWSPAKASRNHLNRQSEPANRPLADVPRDAHTQPKKQAPTFHSVTLSFLFLHISWISQKASQQQQQKSCSLGFYTRSLLAQNVAKILENWFFNWLQYRDIPFGLRWRHCDRMETTTMLMLLMMFAEKKTISCRLHSKKTFKLIYFIVSHSLSHSAGHRPHSLRRQFRIIFNHFFHEIIFLRCRWFCVLFGEAICEPSF